MFEVNYIYDRNIKMSFVKYKHGFSVTGPLGAFTVTNTCVEERPRI
jgi:hypothetical protein